MVRNYEVVIIYSYAHTLTSCIIYLTFYKCVLLIKNYNSN